MKKRKKGTLIERYRRRGQSLDAQIRQLEKDIRAKKEEAK